LPWIAFSRIVPNSFFASVADTAASSIPGAGILPLPARARNRRFITSTPLAILTILAKSVKMFVCGAVPWTASDALVGLFTFEERRAKGPGAGRARPHTVSTHTNSTSWYILTRQAPGLCVC
jgi:hypothetical protein